MAGYFAGKVVMITGASAGIGLELGRQLGELGAKLVLVARRREPMEELAASIQAQGHGAPLLCVADVRDEQQMAACAAQVRQQVGRLDIVIANAGFGVVGQYQSLELADYHRQFDTNVWGVMKTLHATLPLLQESRGQVVFMGSVAGHISVAGSSAYSMSKFALRALAQALIYELRPLGVSVTLLSPGFVESEIRQVNNRGERKTRDKSGMPPSTLVVPTTPAVREMLRAIARKKREAVITRHGKFLSFLGRFFPGLLLRAAARFRNI